MMMQFIAATTTKVSSIIRSRVIRSSTRGGQQQRRLWLLPVAATTAFSAVVLEELVRHKYRQESGIPDESSSSPPPPSSLLSSLRQRAHLLLPNIIHLRRSSLQAQASTMLDSTSMPPTTTTTTTGSSTIHSPPLPVAGHRKMRHKITNLARKSTIRKMQDMSTRASLESKYDVRWENMLGQGAFGAVYLAVHRDTAEKVAVKKISKKFTDNVAFQREMNALLHLKAAGGHPNICSLHEHFDEDGYYYVVLDLISGGEMFDHLVSNGAFSEHDASRLVREVASSLAFIHGLDTVHGDLKPENLMLSTNNPLDAVIKLVDFGCAQVSDEDSDFYEGEDPTTRNDTGTTPAYCPPEVLDGPRDNIKMEPTMDMWALGAILYIMLTGLHPYDLTANATDEEIVKAVISRKPPPLKNSPITAHLSESAIDIIEKLMMADPKKRITALQMLEHPWVKGETASRSKMADSDKKLNMRLQARVFEKFVNWSDNDTSDVSQKTSLIERTFREFISKQKQKNAKKDLETETFEPSPNLSLSGFSDMLSENMKNKYFPKGHTIYAEGEIGHHMYFINSGVIEVVTKDGSRVTRGPGNFFGEGALLNPKKTRSATIYCKTPVHAMEISREYFEKYLATSDSALFLTLKEKDKIRKRNRAKTILRLQKNLVERNFKKDEHLFDPDEDGDSIFLVESGLVDIIIDGKNVLTATPGNICGEHSVLTGRLRNCTAICAAEGGCVTQQMMKDNFLKLVESSPEVKESLRDLSRRRDFKKAVVKRLNKEFPYDNPREAFDALCSPGSTEMDIKTIAKIMREMNPEYTHEEILEIVGTMDLHGSGKVTFDEFEKVFIADIRKSAAM